MKLTAFSILDGKSGIYNRPWFAVSTGVALRNFSDLVNDPKTEVSRHPEDYTICELGTYDDTTGTFEGLVSPKPLGNASQYIVHNPEVK